jgi:hypothetical protein
MSEKYGMSNPFIVQNGLIVNADAVITGSISSSTATINRLVVRDGTTAYMDAKLATNVSSYSVVDYFTGSLGNSAKWTLSISDGTNLKTSEMMCIWNPSTNESSYAEYTTNALGTVAGFLSVNMSSGNVNLIANPLTGSWTIKILRFII